MRVAITRQIGYPAFLTISLIVVLYAVLAGLDKPSEVRAVYGSEAEVVFTSAESTAPLPEINFKDGKGEILTLADFSGNYVLLNVWATWCLPCREEMPALNRLQEKMSDLKFKVIPVSIEGYNTNSINLIMEFYLKHKLNNLEVYIDNSGELSSSLNVIGVPTTLLINQDGLEIGRKVGAAEWDSDEIVKQIREHMRLTRSQPE